MIRCPEYVGTAVKIIAPGYLESEILKKTVFMTTIFVKSKMAAIQVSGQMETLFF